MNILSFTILQAIIDWGEIAATAISAVGVLIAVKLLTWFLPILRQRYPWIIPILAVLGPAGLTKLAEILLAVLGHPVDFGPLIDMLAGGGALAVVAHQVYKQSNKGDRPVKPLGRFRRAAPIFIIGAMLSAPAFGQGYDKNRGRPEAEKIDDARFDLQLERIAVGFGAFLNQTSLSTDMLFGAIQLHGIGLPFIREGTSTGIALEGHITKIFTEQIDGVTVQSFETMDWRVWSITRVPVSAIPVKALQSGTPARMFLIADVLIAEGGPVDWTDGFEFRGGFGGDLGIIGPGNLVIEVYSQRDIPVAVGLVYGF